MRVIFMGTPDFSVPTLQEIAGHGHEIVACYSQPPRPSGRGQAERKSPVHQAAEALRVPVFTPKNFKADTDRAQFAALDADVAVVVAYGLLLPKAILDAPRLGCLNLHGSLLPRWRGAAPIQRAIMAGDTQTGVMVMQMDEGLDTGPVGLAETIPVSADMTTGQLHDEMMRRGADLMARALAALERGSFDFKPQSEQGATHAKKIDKAESRIDWSKPADEVHNHIRGLSPFPGAWTQLQQGGKPVRIKILRSTRAEGEGQPGEVLTDDLTIACGSGAVRLIEVQREGKSAMNAADFLRGTGSLTGQMLGGD